VFWLCGPSTLSDFNECTSLGKRFIACFVVSVLNMGRFVLKV
jgi:hypothetical protein